MAKPHCAHRLTYEEAQHKLASHIKATGARRSPTRDLILSCIFSQPDAFTCSSLHQALEKATKLKSKGAKQSPAAKDSVPDWTTVHRNLNYLTEIGIIVPADLKSDQTIYEIAAADPDHHHHYMVCNNCEEKTLLNGCHVTALIDSLKEQGFKALTHSLEVRGLCPDCVQLLEPKN